MALALATFGCSDDDTPSPNEIPNASSSGETNASSSSGETNTSSSSGETNTSSGGGADKPLSEASADDIRTLCERDGGSWSKPSEAERYGACLSNAAQVTLEECIDETEACEDVENYDLSIPSCEAFGQALAPYVEGCDAPLSLLISCRREQSEALQAFFAPFATVTTCEEAKPHDPPRGLTASCEQLLTRCPGLAN